MGFALSSGRRDRQAVKAVAASVGRMGGASLADILADPAPFAPLPAPAQSWTGRWLRCQVSASGCSPSTPGRP